MIDLKTENLLINKEVNENLESILKKKAFSNGYIFHGPEGIGKKDTAIKFIKAIFNKYVQTLGKLISKRPGSFLSGAGPQAGDTDGELTLGSGASKEGQ